ncbi:MAG: endonuclease [Parcubacteria group bacterium]|nr:MAG: endonuclease [Parcubacteria group bacterium]
MFIAYILKSIKFDAYYTGHCQNMHQRLLRHNKGLVKSTKRYAPWKLVHQEDFTTKNDAYRREMQIKSYKGGQAFKKLIDNK